MKRLVALLYALCFSSCSTTGTYVEPEGPAETVALVSGREPGFLAAINPLRRLPGNTLATVWLVSVDGEPLSHSGWSGWPLEIRVTPGPHTIGAKGRIEVEAVVLEDEGEVLHHFLAGRTYQLEVNLAVGGMLFDIGEVRGAAE